MRDRPRDPRDSDALWHGKGRCAAGAAARGASTFRGVGCQPDKRGSFYVFELKRARSPDHAIDQLARYMGWVRHTIGAQTRVHGIIVAKQVSDKLRYAVSVF